MRKVIVRLVVDAVLVAAVLFGAAGTLAWWRAWVLLAVLLVIRLAGAVAVNAINPEMLRERASAPVHADQPRADRLLLLGVLATGFLGTPLVAGLDVFHWRLLPRVPAALAALGLLAFSLGWILKNVALRANAFAVTVVRLQQERRHAVAESGVYGVVRHPFYAADPLIFVGLGLWLGSYAAVSSAVVPVALMVARLQREEQFLRRELPGYEAYADRVRYRLVPGVW